MCIDNVQRTRDSAHHHAYDNQSEEHVRHQPSISRDILSDDTKPIQPGAAEDQLEDHEEDAELRLVLPSVEFNHDAVHRIGEKAR